MTRTQLVSIWTYHANWYYRCVGPDTDTNGPFRSRDAAEFDARKRYRLEPEFISPAKVRLHRAQIKLHKARERLQEAKLELAEARQPMPPDAPPMGWKKLFLVGQRIKSDGNHNQTM
jgi:hypothetical protein